MTKKARFINQLVSLSASEKETVIGFFSKNPVYESSIDWNCKTLTYGDFEKVIAAADSSNKNIKKESKIDPQVLFEGKNCRIVGKSDDYLIVTPLDWECAIFLNSFDCGGEGAKWCIGDKNNFNHWNQYILNNIIFYFLFFVNQHPIYGKKMIFQYNRENKKFSDSDLFPNLYGWNAENKFLDTLIILDKSIFRLIVNDINSLDENSLPQQIDMDNTLKIIFRQNDESGLSCAQVKTAIQIFFSLLYQNYGSYNKNQMEDALKKYKAVYEKIKEKA